MFTCIFWIKSHLFQSTFYFIKNVEIKSGRFLIVREFISHFCAWRNFRREIHPSLLHHWYIHILSHHFSPLLLRSATECSFIPQCDNWETKKQDSKAQHKAEELKSKILDKTSGDNLQWKQKYPCAHWNGPGRSRKLFLLWCWGFLFTSDKNDQILKICCNVFLEVSVGQLDAAIWIFRGWNATEMSGRENSVVMMMVIRGYAGPERHHSYPYRKATLRQVMTRSGSDPPPGNHQHRPFPSSEYEYNQPSGMGARLSRVTAVIGLVWDSLEALTGQVLSSSWVSCNGH